VAKYRRLYRRQNPEILNRQSALDNDLHRRPNRRSMGQNGRHQFGQQTNRNRHQLP
jgi:hypothetical protein